jgi:integrase
VGTRDEALLTLALRTGMRQGELAALRWEDFDLTDKPFITVRRSADTRTKTRVSTTKTGKERKIRIGPRTVDVLKAHRAKQLEERMAAASWADSGLVFPNTKGKIRRRHSLMRSLRRFLEEAALPKNVRFHDPRIPPAPWRSARAFLSTRSPRWSAILTRGLRSAATHTSSTTCATMPPGRWTNFSDPTLDPNRPQHRPT